MKYMNILFYGLLGAVLALCGISITDRTTDFLVIMMLVIAIDLNSFYTARGY